MTRIVIRDIGSNALHVRCYVTSVTFVMNNGNALEYQKCNNVTVTFRFIFLNVTEILVTRYTLH